MLRRPAIIDELKAILSDWVAGLTSPKALAAYLFGSTVNEDGVRFDPTSGDLDVVLVLDWENLPQVDRVKQLRALATAKAKLESRLFSVLHREDGLEQIVSLIPLTPFEIEQGAHKDHIGYIMTGAPAYDLVAKKEIPNLGGGQATIPLSEVHRPTLAFVQKKRAEAVSIRPNGTGGLEPEAHGDDPVPKELSRHLAAATYDAAKDSDPSDVVRGLRRVSEFASGAADWSPMTTAFESWLEVRQGTRGRVDEIIAADHYLLLVETIFDRLRAQYPSSATVRFIGHAPAPVRPPAPMSLPAQGRLSSSFTITLADKLGGSPSGRLRAIRAARSNMKARLLDPFALTFEEDPDAVGLIDLDEAELSDADHRRMVQAVDRRTLVMARQSRWQEGINLILYYAGTLFAGDDHVVEECCATAIENWISVAATNAINPGGAFEAMHRDFYPSHGFVVRFSGAGSLQNALGGGLPLDALDPKQLAGGFAPNLVSVYLHQRASDPNGFLARNEARVFDVREWEYGVI